MHRKKVLILNNDFTAIGLIDWTKAVTLDCKGLVRVVDYYRDEFIMSAGEHKWPSPAVVALTSYKKPQKKDVPFSRKNVFLRDKLTCQYCRRRFKSSDLTYDHVIPRAKWKSDSTCTCWENIVSCCYSCNSRKADKTLKESGMVLAKVPRKPDPNGFIIGFAPWTKIQPEWIPYLPKHFLELMDHQ